MRKYGKSYIQQGESSNPIFRHGRQNPPAKEGEINKFNRGYKDRGLEGNPVLQIPRPVCGQVSEPEPESIYDDGHYIVRYVTLADSGSPWGGIGRLYELYCYASADSFVTVDPVVFSGTDWTPSGTGNLLNESIAVGYCKWIFGYWDHSSAKGFSYNLVGREIMDRIRDHRLDVNDGTTSGGDRRGGQAFENYRSYVHPEDFIEDVSVDVYNSNPNAYLDPYARNAIIDRFDSRGRGGDYPDYTRDSGATPNHVDWVNGLPDNNGNGTLQQIAVYPIKRL